MWLKKSCALKMSLRKKIQFFLVVEVSGDIVDTVELLGLLLGWTDWN
jgi:hypothetical protein